MSVRKNNRLTGELWMTFAELAKYLDTTAEAAWEEAQRLGWSQKFNQDGRTVIRVDPSYEPPSQRQTPDPREKERHNGSGRKHVGRVLIRRENEISNGLKLALAKPQHKDPEDERFWVSAKDLARHLLMPPGGMIKEALRHGWEQKLDEDGRTTRIAYRPAKDELWMTFGELGKYVGISAQKARTKAESHGWLMRPSTETGSNSKVLAKLTVIELWKRNLESTKAKNDAGAERQNDELGKYKPSRNLTGDEFRVWRLETGTPEEVAELLGTTAHTILHFEKNGCSKMIALAIAAIEAGLDPWAP
jgi:hypothetical protein